MTLNRTSLAEALLEDAMQLVTDGHDAGDGAAALRFQPAPARKAPVRSKGAPSKGAPTKKGGQLPADAEFILSALEAGSHAGQAGIKERRKSDRSPYRVLASLKLFSDSQQAPPWTLYVRDVGPGGLGFVTKHRLPLGYGGILTIQTPDGRTQTIDCTLLRCREAIQGWFEGSMYFNREQVVFDKANMKAD